MVSIHHIMRWIINQNNLIITRETPPPPVEPPPTPPEFTPDAIPDTEEEVACPGLAS